MTRDEAVTTWRDVCGSDTVMSMGVVTGRMLEEFARRIETAERERCAKIVEEYNPGGSYHIRTALAAEIRRA